MLVFFDTNVWIYAFENHPVFGGPAPQFRQALASENHRLASSSFVLGELLVMPTKQNNLFALAAYKRLFASPSLTVLPYSLAATKTYAVLRAFDRVKALDAIHLAVAAAGGVNLFITQDADLLSLKVPGIGRIVDLSYKFS